MNTFCMYSLSPLRALLALVLTATVCQGTACAKKGAPATNQAKAAALTTRLLSIRLPKVDKGRFQIAVYTADVQGARSLTLGPPLGRSNVVFVGTMGQGKVYAVHDQDGDGVAERVVEVAGDLSTPNGVAYNPRDGFLYVAEIHRILRYKGTLAAQGIEQKPEVVLDTLPKDGHHGWKFIRFAPHKEGEPESLFIPVGAPCNVCLKDDPRYASILRLSLPKPGQTAKDPEVYASGVRNSVGFDFHPETGQLWFTDNGRDMLGDDLPPDELNRVEGPGQHFGFPYCHGGEIPDPEFGKKRPCKEFTPPARKLGPHVAAIGMRFYTGNQFPASYKNQILIAEHGSWNRSKPIGYRVSLVKVSKDQALSYEPFAEGFLQDQGAWGRPADVQVMPDGALLVSDDRNGAIYRISYSNET